MTPRTKRLLEALIRAAKQGITAFEKWVEEAPLQ